MLQLAPGVSFIEKDHTYWYKGKKLSGITGMVSKKLGLKYNGDFVGEHAEEGIHVHKAVQRWIETGNPESVHPGVLFFCNTFLGYNNLVDKKGVAAEVLVSDFRSYASSVDIILEAEGGLVLFDIKTGIFKREYCTWQLNIYRYFIEKFAARRVAKMVVISTKDKDYYPIFAMDEKKIEGLLYGRTS